MTWYVRATAGALIISLIGLALIILQTTPVSASSLLRGIFFALVFVVLWSAATLMSYLIRRRNEALFAQSFSEGLLVSLILFALLLIHKFI